MPSITLTMNGLLDDAVERLPRRKQRRMKRRLKNPEFRDEVLDSLIDDCCCDPDCESLGLKPLFGSESFDGATPFSIDVDKLERLLEIILKYLPKFLEIILPLFTKPVAGASLLLLFCLPSFATAQECVGDVCPLPSVMEKATPSAVSFAAFSPPPAAPVRTSASYVLSKSAGVVRGSVSRGRSLVAAVAGNVANRRERRISRRRARVERFGVVGLKFLRR